MVIKNKYMSFINPEDFDFLERYPDLISASIESLIDNFDVLEAYTNNICVNENVLDFLPITTGEFLIMTSLFYLMELEVIKLNFMESIFLARGWWVLNPMVYAVDSYGETPLFKLDL